jgi:hypothetical protein
VLLNVEISVLTIDILYTDDTVRSFTGVKDWVLEDCILSIFNNDKHFVNINHVRAWKVKEEV